MNTHDVRKYGVTLAAVALLALLFFFSPYQVQSYPELEELAPKAGSWKFQDYSAYFRSLSESKGAPYAFEILKRAQISPGTDLHLLGHLVGDMLYKQQGIDGIHICTQDFRNACSHSVVIGILNEHGEGALSTIAETCKKAPGGLGAYTMCFHGLGHGVLAYNEYNFEKAVGMCQKVGTAEHQNRESIECIGGMTMEMISGVHDRDAWAKQKDTYFKIEDRLYPCNAPFVPKDARPICYVHLTPYLFMSAGMNLGTPNPALYEKAFSFCSTLPIGEERDACYGGFGKEFVVLAQEKDVRDIGSMKELALRNVRTWCRAAQDEKGETECNSHALGSLFWGGENKPDAAVSFCAIAEGAARERCFQELVGISTYYLRGNKARAFCALLPSPHSHICSANIRY